MKITKRVYRYVKRALSKWRCFWRARYFPHSACVYGVDQYINTKKGVKYGIVDEMVVNGYDYLFLVNDKDPYDYCIKQCVAEEGKTFITAIENKREFSVVLDRFMDNQRSMSEAMHGFLDYLNYGELKQRNEMSRGMYVGLHILLLIPVLLNFLALKIGYLGVQHNGIVISDSSSTWSYIITMSVISVLGILVTIKNHRTFTSIWSNIISVIGLTMAFTLLNVTSITVVLTMIIWFAITTFYIIMALKTNAPTKNKYVRLATQRLAGAYYVSRSLLALASFFFSILFIVNYMTGHITIVTTT